MITIALHYILIGLSDQALTRGILMKHQTTCKTYLSFIKYVLVTNDVLNFKDCKESRD